MGRVVAPLCECQGTLLTDAGDELEPWTPRRCLHCGKPTPPGKWRCGPCQLERDTAAMRAVLEAGRRETSHTHPL